MSGVLFFGKKVGSIDRWLVLISSGRHQKEQCVKHRSTEAPRAEQRAESREQRAEAIAKATVEDGPGHEHNERLRVPKRLFCVCSTEVSSVIQVSPSAS